MTNKFTALHKRRKTKIINIGNISIGVNNPIRVQTMTNTDTLNIKQTVQQIIKCHQFGCELIRLTTQTPQHAAALSEIRNELKKHKIEIPLIADVHFSPETAFSALHHADKVRINPGNIFDKRINSEQIFNKHEYQKELKQVEKNMLKFILEAKKTKTPIRIGANHGSLSDRILSKYGNTHQGMVESVMEYLRIFKKHNFNEIIVALKASNPLIMIEANRMLIDKLNQEDMDYPLHLGVTEAGNAEEGRAKSTIGIGTLLLEGLGDTIRVSLTEAPEQEIPVCYSILQATQRRITKAEFISCPSCGRTLFDLETVTNNIKAKLSHLKGVRIAIMGCIVNGIGEMGEADFGYVGSAPGKIDLYHKKTRIHRGIPESEALDKLIALIKQNKQWQ